MKTVRTSALFLAVTLAACLQSLAQGLSPNSLPYPDLAGGFVGVTYTTSDGAFQASGYTMDYVDPSGDDLFQGLDTYALNATISSGGVLSSGSLSISGDVGAGDTLLLSGNLVAGAAGTAFGYSGFDANGYHDFQFLFKVTGGSLMSDYGGVGAEGWVDLAPWFDTGSGDVPFTGSWSSDFNNSGSGSGVMDTLVVVPEPAGLALVLLGGLVGAMVKRGRA